MFRLVLLACSVLATLTGCGGPAERIKETAAKSPTPAPTPSEREISGVFKVEGAGPNGESPYTGVLNVAPQGDVYGFRWQTTRGSRIGSGVQIGNAAAVGYAATGGGKGCGAALYRIASDGSLDGKIVMWGEESFTPEKAVKTEGRGFGGEYKLDKGTLSITKDGAGYRFEWKIDKPRVAFGIWKGSVAAASFGGRQCGFALYDVQSNGNLDGDWGSQAAVIFGKETASRN